MDEKRKELIRAVLRVTEDFDTFDDIRRRVRALGVVASTEDIDSVFRELEEFNAYIERCTKLDEEGRQILVVDGPPPEIGEVLGEFAVWEEIEDDGGG